MNDKINIWGLASLFEVSPRIYLAMDAAIVEAEAVMKRNPTSSRLRPSAVAYSSKTPNSPSEQIIPNAQNKKVAGLELTSFSTFYNVKKKSLILH